MVEPEAAYFVQKLSAQSNDMRNFSSTQGKINIPSFGDRIGSDAKTLDYQVNNEYDTIPITF